MAPVGRDERPRRLDDRAWYALQIVAVATAYTVSGKLGLDLAFATRSVTAIWPPTGIALAALILGGYRLWPAVALGALLTNLNTGVPPVTVFGIVLGNTLEALTGAYLLRRVAGFSPRLERVSDVISLVVFGAVISTAVSATIGVTSLLIGDATSWARVPSLWRTWWLGDMGGDLIVAPVLLIAATYRRYRQLPGGPIEAATLTVVLAGVSGLELSESRHGVYALFPLLIWAALRFWQPGAAGASLLAAAIAVAFTAHGKGPFAMSGPNDRLLLAQTFVAVAGVTALILAAVTSERRRAEESEREIAETLQRSLLPDAAPSIAGWEVATLYRPAGAAEVEVGGDFYDFFASPGGWIVILGDVVGKGVRAAAMAGLVRHGARFVSQTESGPAAILARLDDVLRQQATMSLCSALCLRVHPDHLLVSSAGHPGPLVVRADGRIREIGDAGQLLGVEPGGRWPERTVHVGVDETVLLYTDGVTDTRGRAERFGLWRLRELLIEHADLSPDPLLAALESGLDRFQAGPQSDDTAALALRPEPSPAAGGPRSRVVAPRASSRPRPGAPRILAASSKRPDETPGPYDYSDQVALELPVSDQAPRLARAEVREAIIGLVPESESELAVLITSELVTNAVVHPVHPAGASIGLWIGTGEGRVRVEVADSGCGFEPGELTRNDKGAGGRGLLIIGRGATRWGISRNDRFSVWFELEA